MITEKKNQTHTHACMHAHTLMHTHTHARTHTHTHSKTTQIQSLMPLILSLQAAIGAIAYDQARDDGDEQMMEYGEKVSLEQQLARFVPCCGKREVGGVGWGWEESCTLLYYTNAY